MFIKKFKSKVRESDFERDFTNELYNKIDQVREELGFPSLQVSIIYNDKKFNCSSGLSNIEKKKNSTLNSVYYLGCVSKVFVKGVILRLVQDGEIALDDSITKYINLTPYGQDVTLKDLLHHKSGLFDPIETNRDKVIHLGERWTIDEILNEVRNNEPYFEAGKKYNYSHVDYILLGLVAEKVSNKGFSELLNEYFFKPLKINNIFYPVKEKLPKLLAAGYDTYEYKPKNGDMMANIQHYPIFIPTLFMSGSLVGNSLNVSKFLHGLFVGNILNDESKRTARLFFGIKQFSGVVFREQVGYIPGYKSFCGYSPSYNLTVTILTNYSDGQLIYDATEKIIDFFLNSKVVKPLVQIEI